jgi:hypothetical protein
MMVVAWTAEKEILMHDRYYGPTSEDYDNARKVKESYIRVGELAAKVEVLETAVAQITTSLERVTRILEMLVMDDEGTS